MSIAKYQRRAETKVAVTNVSSDGGDWFFIWLKLAMFLQRTEVRFKPLLTNVKKSFLRF
jgi:hypothetical protein